METMTYRFTGAITAESPLQANYREATPGNDPIQRLPRNGSLKSPPYFPSTSIRGALRHAMHNLVLRATKASSKTEKPFDLKTHFMLAQGMDITNTVYGQLPNYYEIDFADALRTANPGLSLFGRWKLAAKLGVGPAIPQTSDCITLFGGGARGVMFERNETLLDELTDENVKHYKALLIEQATTSVDIKAVKAELAAQKKQLRGADDQRKTEIYETMAPVNQPPDPPLIKR